MHTNKIFPLISLLILALISAACTTAPSSTPQSPEPGGVTPTAAQPTQSLDATPSLPPGVQAAQKAVAARLGIEPSQVIVQSFEQVDWPDSCLGLQGMLEGQVEECLDVITPGYVGTLSTEQELFEFHSDLDGQQVRLIPGAALAARQALSQELGISPSQVQVVLVEAAEWPDSCLGLPAVGQVCAQVITPGYRVLLIANSGEYEYHTDQTGANVVQASSPATQTSLTWAQTIEGQCEQAIIRGETVAYSACGSDPVDAPFANTQRASDLAEFGSLFSSFEADTPAGTIRFTGQGQVTATPWQQRMLAEWARLTVQEARLGGSEASLGLAIKWRRQVSADDNCGEVRIYASGEAIASQCDQEPPQASGRLQLISSQLQTLYNWIDTLQSFDLLQTEFIESGNLTTNLNFYGAGQANANAPDQNAMQDLSAQILAQLGLQTDSADLQAAREALKAYLDALSQARYADAASLYGGDYQVLRSNNPGLAPDDSAALFQAACTLNGFICDLNIKNEVQAAQISPGKFRITVELQSPDGVLFALGPCCGADPQVEPPLTQFDFIIVKTEGRFLVIDLPIYVP